MSHKMYNIYAKSSAINLYREDITWWHEDMNFIFEWQNNIYEQAQRVSKILFLPRENKIHIFKPLCNVLFII